MSFKARLPDGTVHEASAIGRDAGPFCCHRCGGAMHYVQGLLRTTAHFRHAVETNCAWEPETPEHEGAKMAVCEAINRIGIGAAEVEVQVGPWEADVLWRHNGKSIAFEIQRAPYEWAKFAEKIAVYLSLGVPVVYLFIGDAWRTVTERCEYRLKELEQMLLTGGPTLPDSPDLPDVIRRRWPSIGIRRQQPGPAYGAYLQNLPESGWRVDQPCFVPAMRGNRSLTETFKATGHVFSPLDDYLRSLAPVLLSAIEGVVLEGVSYQSVTDAAWSVVFAACAIRSEYVGEGADRHFLLHGENDVIASTDGAVIKRIGRSTKGRLLRLENPTVGAGRVFLCGELSWGDLREEEPSYYDRAVLGHWLVESGQSVFDFAEETMDFTGALHGHHTSSSAGTDGDTYTHTLINIWAQAKTMLATGHVHPITAAPQGQVPAAQ